MKFPEAGSSGSKLPYVKLKDGESISGVFKGDIEVFYQVWGKGRVPKGTPDASMRFNVNFITREGSSYVAKVFSQGKLFLDEMEMAQNEAGKPLENVAVKIFRKGTGKDDTKYRISVLSDQPSAKGWEVINAVPLINLSSKPSEEPPFDDAPLPNKEHPDPYQDDELPF